MYIGYARVGVLITLESTDDLTDGTKTASVRAIHAHGHDRLVDHGDQARRTLARFCSVLMTHMATHVIRGSDRRSHCGGEESSTRTDYSHSCTRSVLLTR